MNKTIITISCEFGSVGKNIGKAVAETLSIPYYDKEIIKQVTKRPDFRRSMWRMPGTCTRKIDSILFAITESAL